MGGLGWTPDAFWRATPADVRLAAEGRRQAAGNPKPMLGDELADLMAAYPDGGSIRGRGA